VLDTVLVDQLYNAHPFVGHIFSQWEIVKPWRNGESVHFFPAAFKKVAPFTQAACRLKTCSSGIADYYRERQSF
jgi:hypothetical protein